jgi:hypothetical protein
MRTIRSGLMSHLACLALAASGLGIIYLGSPLPVDGVSVAPTALTLAVPSQATIGQDVTVVARLTSGGLPVTSRRVSFLLDGTLLGGSGVNSDGVADFRILGKFLSTAGHPSVTVVFRGSSSLGPSQATGLLNLAPALITIRTVPAIDGIQIRLGQQEGLTSDGMVTFAVPTIGAYDLAPDVHAASDAATRADFVKWSDNVFTANRTLAVEGDTVLELGLRIAHRGSFRFVSQDGDPVDPSRIGRVTLTSTGGREQTFTNFDEVWLESATVVRRLDGLGVAGRNWRVVDVQIAGTNVVNRGQQHLVPAPDAVWQIVVLLYDLQVAPVDALFGSDVHGTIDLTYPDGTVQTESIDAAHPRLAFASLPRGNYTVRLHTLGLGAPTAVALSRDQTASIRVLTYLDLGLLGLVMLGIVAVLLSVGRRQQIFAYAWRIWAPVGGKLSSWVPLSVSSRAGELRRGVGRGLASARDEISRVAGRPYARTVEWLETQVGRRLHSALYFVGIAAARPAPPTPRPHKVSEAPSRPAPPTPRRHKMGEAPSLPQARRVDTVEEPRTARNDTVKKPRTARKDTVKKPRTARGALAAQIAASLGAPSVADGEGELWLSRVASRSDGKQPGAPQPRVCRRCGNRMPDGKGVCQRCPPPVNGRR